MCCIFMLIIFLFKFWMKVFNIKAKCGSCIETLTKSGGGRKFKHILVYFFISIFGSK